MTGVGVIILSAIILMVATVHLLMTVGYAAQCRKHHSLKKFPRTSLTAVFQGAFYLLPFVLALVFSIAVLVSEVKGDGCPQEWQWHFGLFAILFGWTILILKITKLNIIGVYALTFITIVQTFIKLSLFAILLVLASSIVLKMVLFDPRAVVRRHDNICPS